MVILAVQSSSTYLAEKLLTSTACVFGVINVNVVIFPRDGLFEKRLLNGDSIDVNLVVLFVKVEVLVAWASIAVYVDGDGDGIGPALGVNAAAVK